MVQESLESTQTADDFFLAQVRGPVVGQSLHADAEEQVEPILIDLGGVLGRGSIGGAQPEVGAPLHVHLGLLGLDIVETVAVSKPNRRGFQDRGPSSPRLKRGRK